MSYSRVHGDGLRLYIDSMNWMFSRGLPRSTEWTDRNTGAWAWNAAAKDNKYSLIDANPMKAASYNSSLNPTGHMMHEMDFQVIADNPIRHLAIMGHNAVDAEACFRLCYDTSVISAAGAGTTVGSSATPPVVVLNGTINPDTGISLTEDISGGETDWDVDSGAAFTEGELILAINTVIELQEVVKVTGIAGNTLTVTRAQQGTAAIIFFASDCELRRYNVVEPATDGDTIISFSEVSNKRFWAIEVIPSDGAYHGSKDLEVGSYQIGNYHDFAIAPDLNVNHGFIQEGVNTRQTPAGRQITFAHHLSNNDSTDEYSPFRYNDDYFRRMVGKEQWAMTWKGDDDVNVYPSDISAMTSGSLLEDLILKTGINFLPFILCTNNSSTDEGDYMWAILDQASFETLQKSWQWVGWSLKFIQKF